LSAVIAIKDIFGYQQPSIS